MHLQLRPEVQKFVEDRVRSGQYASTEEVVEAGIARLMLDPEPSLDEQTFLALDDRETQADRGEVVEWQALKAQLLSKYLRR